MSTILDLLVKKPDAKLVSYVQKNKPDISIKIVDLLANFIIGKIKTDESFDEFIGLEIDVNLKDVNGMSLLMTASQHGKSKMVESLLKNGAKTELDGVPALYYASYFAITTDVEKNSDCVRLLLSAGADVEKVKPYGDKYYWPVKYLAEKMKNEKLTKSIEASTSTKKLASENTVSVKSATVKAINESASNETLTPKPTDDFPNVLVDKKGNKYAIDLKVKPSLLIELIGSSEYNLSSYTFPIKSLFKVRDPVEYQKDGKVCVGKLSLENHDILIELPTRNDLYHLLPVGMIVDSTALTTPLVCRFKGGIEVTDFGGETIEVYANMY